MVSNLGNQFLFRHCSLPQSKEDTLCHYLRSYRTVIYERLPSRVGDLFIKRLTNYIQNGPTPKAWKTHIKGVIASKTFHRVGRVFGKKMGDGSFRKLILFFWELSKLVNELAVCIRQSLYVLMCRFTIHYGFCHATYLFANGNKTFEFERSAYPQPSILSTNKPFHSDHPCLPPPSVTLLISTGSSHC